MVVGITVAAAVASITVAGITVAAAVASITVVAWRWRASLRRRWWRALRPQRPSQSPRPLWLV